ncbi:TPA: hypothetical protein HA246_06100 [Candidatus Woesearchaeota archaeon]|nr:hypothetical protein [Candidatus Woesearchaeota archaeon]
MQRKDYDDGEEVACKVRADFEARKIDEVELKLLYQQYNPLEDIDIFMQRAGEMFPNLNCGLTTVYLKKLFPNGKLINGRYKNNNHTFLLLDESIVVDITSDQYDGPKVYVGPLQKPWSLK